MAPPQGMGFQKISKQSLTTPPLIFGKFFNSMPKTPQKLSVLEAPPVPKDFKRSSHLFQILQKSVNDEQYEIYKGPGSDGHVTSNLRIKALRVRLNCKMIQWEFEMPIYRIFYPFFPKLSIQKCRQFLIET